MPKKKGAQPPQLKKHAFKKGNARAWKKGQSGNPNGRPRLFESIVSQNLARLMRAENPLTGNSNAGDMAQGLFDMVMRKVEKRKPLSSSEVTLVTYIIDRVEGRPTQTLQMPELAKLLDGHTDEEKEFFSAHGYWPTGVEQGQPGTTGS